MKFDAGLPGGVDAVGLDADPIDNGTIAPDAAAMDAEEAEIGFPDAEEAEAGFPDAERAEVGPPPEDATDFPDAERAEIGPDDEGVADVGVDDAGDGGIFYDATICTGQSSYVGPCADCGEASCCTELANCVGDATCYGEYTGCFPTCLNTASVSFCLQQCFVSAPGVDFKNCMNLLCSAVCP